MNLAFPPAARPTLYGTQYMIASGHPLATMAGLRVLEAGGNAIDAGVAAGFALNVVQPDMANLGGVAPVLLRLAETGRVTTISGVGRWPSRASAADLREAGGGRIPASPLRWVVPAAVDAWITTLQRYGTRSLGEVLEPAIALAERGFPADYFLYHNLCEAQDAMAAWPSTRDVFLPTGRPPAVGDIVVQRELGQTLRLLVEAEAHAAGSREDALIAARDAFYRGEVAERVDSFARELGAYLRADDLHAFQVTEESAVSTTYRGHRVFACGPWSQGPAVLQMLNLVERLGIENASASGAEHLAIESVKLALLDRNRWYGDPAIVDVPMERLLSKAYAAEAVRAVAPDRVLGIEECGPQHDATPDTTYVCVVDRDGNAFSATPSDSTMLVTPLVPGLGFAISDRGLQSSLDPNDPNVVAPGKRPRLTPNPGLVVSDAWVMPYGTPGGEVQTQAMLQFLINLLNRGMDLQDAVEAPRWASYAVPATEDPHTCQEGLVRMEAGCHDVIGADLIALGHRIERWPDRHPLAGGICAVRRHNRSGVVAGCADPRRRSYGMGW